MVIAFVFPLVLCRCLTATNPNATSAAGCEFLYNGQGIEYQVLAGPVYVVVATVSGVIFGALSDRMNR